MIRVFIMAYQIGTDYGYIKMGEDDILKFADI